MGAQSIERMNGYRLNTDRMAPVVGRRGTIMVIGCPTQMDRQLGSRLRQELYTVIEAAGPGAALMMIASGHVDAVILHHGLGMDCVAMARAIRCEDPGLPIIVRSSTPDAAGVVERVLAEGVHSCFSDPLDLVALLSALDTLMPDAQSGVHRMF